MQGRAEFKARTFSCDHHSTLNCQHKYGTQLQTFKKKSWILVSSAFKFQMFIKIYFLGNGK